MHYIKFSNGNGTGILLRVSRVYLYSRPSKLIKIS